MSTRGPNTDLVERRAERRALARPPTTSLTIRSGAHSLASADCVTKSAVIRSGIAPDEKIRGCGCRCDEKKSLPGRGAEKSRRLTQRCEFYSRWNKSGF